MQISDFLHILEILAWPVVAIAAILVVRPHLSNIFSGTKIKLTIAGVSIETTLPELKKILEEQYAEVLSPEHIARLSELRKRPQKYPGGIGQSDERKFLRPLRNAGLILTSPRSTFLTDATGIEISGLGRLYLRAREGTSKNGA